MSIFQSNGFYGRIVNISTDLVLTHYDNYKTINVNTAGGDVSVILVSAESFNAGREITIKKVSSDINVVKVVGIIDGDTDDYLFDKGESTTIESNGIEWGIIKSHKHEETGITAEFNSSTIPNRYMEEDGRTLNASANPKFARLFAKIGITYGGTGIADFKIPDSRGRIAIGKDDMGGIAANRITTAGCGINGILLGGSGGDQRLATHTHPDTFAATKGTLAISASGSHEHTIQQKEGGTTWTSLYWGDGSGVSDKFIDAAGGGWVAQPLRAASNNHTHPNANFTGAPAITGSVSNNIGGGASANVPPAIIKIKAIKL